MRPALTILAKDLTLRLRDRSVYLFAFVVPLGLTAVFSLVFPAEEDFELTAAVVDLDGGEVAAGFVDELIPALVADDVVEPHPADTEATAREAVATGEADAAWIIPAGFSEAALSGRGAALQVVVNPDRALAAEVARGIAEGYAQRVEQAGLAVATAATAFGAELSARQFEEIGQAAATAPPAIELDELLAPARQLDAISYLAAGMAVFFLFFTVQFGVTGLLEERQQGTLPRLLAAPIGVGAVHLGKALGAFVLGVVSMTVLALASALLLGAHWGQPLGVAVLILAGVLAAVGVMALVGSFARTAEQAGNLQSIVALVLGLLGGVFFPVNGGILGQLALVSPHGWFLRGLADMVGQGHWTAVLPAAAAMVAFGVVAAVPGIVRLRRMTL